MQLLDVCGQWYQGLEVLRGGLLQRSRREVQSCVLGVFPVPGHRGGGGTTEWWTQSSRTSPRPLVTVVRGGVDVTFGLLTALRGDHSESQEKWECNSWTSRATSGVVSGIVTLVWDGDSSLSPRRVWAVMPSHQGRYTHTSSSRFQSHRLTSRSRCSFLVSRFRAFQVHRGRGRAHVDRCLTASVIFLVHEYLAVKQVDAQAQRRLSATRQREQQQDGRVRARQQQQKIDIKKIIILNTEFLHLLLALRQRWCKVAWTSPLASRSC